MIESKSNHQDLSELLVAFDEWQLSEAENRNNAIQAVREFAKDQGIDPVLEEQLHEIIEREWQVRRRHDAVANDATEPVMDQIGTSIGDFHLVRRLGVGGMGSVWLAEQHTPLRREVAIKLIRPESVNRQFLRRFDHERQSLARMSHPNIAQFIDAGEIDQRNPYMVMEFVPGISINEYCEEKKLTIRQRLELFLQVCDAIQHAHQKGIIHRDIKPSNVLVMGTDDQARVKVIDFGLAKSLIESPIDGKSNLSQFVVAIGSPFWMSPEQMNSPTDVDTRSDVYSMGCLLYQLLTGETPIDQESVSDSSWNELRKMVCEKLPPIPSLRVLESADRSEWAEHYGSSRRQLIGTLESELDWVTMKALRVEPNDRYASIGDFAEDIRRYLAGDPVQARPHTIAYRLRKFISKNKLASSLAGVLMFVIIGATIASISLSSWAVNEKKIAELERDKTGNERDIAKQERDTAAAERASAMKERDVAQALVDAMANSFQKASLLSSMNKSEATLESFLVHFAESMDQWATERIFREWILRQTIANALGGIGAMEKSLRVFETGLKKLKDSPKVAQISKINGSLDYAERLFYSSRPIEETIKQMEECDRMTAEFEATDDRPRIRWQFLDSCVKQRTLTGGAEQIPLLEKTLAKAIEIWGPDSHKILDIRLLLASYYRLNGQFREAREQNEEGKLQCEKANPQLKQMFVILFELDRLATFAGLPEEPFPIEDVQAVMSRVDKIFDRKNMTRIRYYQEIIPALFSRELYEGVIEMGSEIAPLATENQQYDTAVDIMHYIAYSQLKLKRFELASKTNDEAIALAEKHLPPGSAFAERAKILECELLFFTEQYAAFLERANKLIKTELLQPWKRKAIGQLEALINEAESKLKAGQQNKDVP